MRTRNSTSTYTEYHICHSGLFIGNMSKNNSNNKKMLKMQELQELQQQFEGIETENSKLTSVIGKIKQEINWYSTYLNKCKKENPTTFNRVINGTFDGSEGINMIDLELHSTGNKQKKISKRNLGPVNSVLGTTNSAETKKTGYINAGLANGFDDIGIDLDFLESTESKQPAFDNDIIVDDLYFDPGALPTSSQNPGNSSNFKLDGLLTNSNSNLNLTQLGLPTPNTNSSILQQVQQYQYQEQNSLLAQQNVPSKTSMNKDEMMLMKSLKDALNNI